MLDKLAKAFNFLKADVLKLEQDVEKLSKVRAIIKDGKPGKDGKSPDVNAIVEAVLAQVPTPKDGKSPDPKMIVAEILPLMPKPRDGRDADPVNVSDVAAIVLSKMPKPKDGKDGPTLETVVKNVKAQLRDGKKGDPGPRGLKGKPGEDGKNGVSVTDVEVKNNDLIVFLDGKRKNVGRINVSSPRPPFAPGGEGSDGGGGSRKLGAVDSLQLKTQLDAPPHSEGLIFYDKVNKSVGFYNDESDVTLQVGQEVWLRGVNNTGSTITNGQVVYISGESGGLPQISLANAGAANTSLPMIGLATHDIEDGSTGIVTRSGTVRDVDTSAFVAGQLLFLDTVDGVIAATPPASPGYQITVGTASIISATIGTIEVNIDIAGNTADVIKIFNGSVLENTNIVVASDGAAITLSLEKFGGGDLSLFFDAAFTAFDSTPAATIALTAGSDISPTLNYIYIPKSTGVLTVNPSAFPTTEQFIPVATVLCQSAASVQVDGCYKCHKWSDNLSDTVSEGHLSHINSWIRTQNASWMDGVAPTTTVTTNPGAIDDVDFQTASGNVLQLHAHTFPARNTATGDPIFAANDSTTAFDKIASLDAIDTTSLGATLRSNNTYYSLVIWGVVSEDDVDCKLYVNAPLGSYSNTTDAISDPLGFNVFTIPQDFRGAGFLIARVVLRFQTAASGTFIELLTEDLRGLIPSIGAGGGGVSAGAEFSDNLFRVQSVADITKELAFDASSVTTGTTRTVTVQDKDGTLALLDSNGVLGLNSFTVAGLPSASSIGMIFVSDETGGAVLAFSDGTNWRRTTDRAIVT